MWDVGMYLQDMSNSEEHGTRAQRIPLRLV